ncbi:hypothetical protein BDQ12DRAFT_688237 [Crucibulum laeve]|uniref:Uncharacterized protein n=1 Tax=Crucibulum laeve TaxID=68775 RepID=A0A5C3LU55_9AGAR|nr:hypothetical protein BDQ12DRAFT_688237 [Crucibulum laeve]
MKPGTTTRPFEKRQIMESCSPNRTGGRNYFWFVFIHFFKIFSWIHLTSSFRAPEN